MFERFTVSARRAVVHSQSEARALWHDHVGPVHLLLGVATAEESTAGAVLTELGIDQERLRQQVIATHGRGEAEPTGHISFTDSGKKAFELALRESLAREQTYIGTAHLLLGLINDPSAETAGIIAGLGVPVETMRDAVADRLRSAAEPTEP
jgi:ATP-dependent Clp protease ATP-binding subunit ClpC